MRMSLRLILSLVIAVTVVSVLFAFYQVKADERGRRNDLEKRAQVLAESLQETVQPLLAKDAEANLQRLVERFGNRERLIGVAIYDLRGEVTFTTPGLAKHLGSPLPVVDKAVFRGNGWGRYFKAGPLHMHLYAVPLRRNDTIVAALAVFDDASYIDAQSTKIWRDTFKHVLIQ